MREFKPLRTIHVELLEKEYGIKNPRERFDIYRTSKDSITLWDKQRNKVMDSIRF